MKQLKNLYNKCTIDEKIDGINWYIEARDFAREISDLHKIDFLKVCGIISALSPSVQWDVNKEQAEKLIFHLHWGERSTCSTYLNNVWKAEQIYHSDGRQKTIEEILYGKAGYKTHAFFLNIAFAESENVTIDRHILAAIGFDKPSLTRKRYRDIEDYFRRTADLIGVAPYVLQATIWINHLNNPVRVTI